VKGESAVLISQALLKAFRTFGGVIHAPIDRLMAIHGVSEGAATALRMAGCAAVHLLRQKISNEPILYTDMAIKDYLIGKMQHERVEVALVLYLDANYRLIGDEILWRGTINRCPVYPREILKRCLDLDVHALILSHNHPSGYLQPSREDIEITKAIVDAASVFDIQVRDHIIVGHGECSSFRQRHLI